MADLKNGTLPYRGRAFRGARLVLTGLASAYVLIVILVMTPFIQTRVLYAHHIDSWWFRKFDHPENYGLAPGKTVNLHLTSSDNTTIGAWFIFSDPFYHKLSYPPPPQVVGHDGRVIFPREEVIPDAVRQHPTILFLHGNTGTRAHPLRTSLYTAFTARLKTNLMVVDYRGFGDSEGHPTVQGVSRDARAAWDYLMSQGAKPEDVLIVGHSLGTAIGGMLSAELSREGVTPRGTVLMSPFSSVRKLIDEYYLFGCLPLLKPLSALPLAPRLITWSLVHRFDTLTLVPQIKSSVLLVHGDDDMDIPATHSSMLFDAFIQPHLPVHPSFPPNPLSHREWENYTNLDALREKRRKDVVVTTRVDGFGLYEEMRPSIVQEEGRQVALLRTERGGHDPGRVEGVHDTIGRLFGLYQVV